MVDEVQCVDLSADRAVGELWEKRFCVMAAHFDRSFTAHQIRRERSAQAFFRQNGKYHPMTLPDITVWTFPGEHHEIKHKDVAGNGCFGLEKYRLDALSWFRRETRQTVYYTIHDYGKQQNDTREQRKKNDKNFPLHWVTCSVEELELRIENTLPGMSWVNGQPREVEIHYWGKKCFRPLLDIWRHDPLLNATADVRQGFGIDVEF